MEKLWPLLLVTLPVTKQNEKEATRNQIAHWHKPSEHVDITEVKHARRVPRAKSIGKGIYVTCYPGTFRGIRVVIK